MTRIAKRLYPILILGAAGLALSGCVAYDGGPYPAGYYGPGYYPYGPPVGAQLGVVVGGDHGHGDHGHGDHWHGDHWGGDTWNQHEGH
jgi:hypothetical protein